MKLAERIGVAAADSKLRFCESQLYAWRSKLKNTYSTSECEQEMSLEIAHLKRQLAEQTEELAILKTPTYFAKRLKRNMSLSKNIGLSSASKPCAVCIGLLVAAGMSDARVVINLVHRQLFRLICDEAVGKSIY